MTAARKALEALEAAGSQARYSASHRIDAANLSVHLSAPLAAVVRAVADRPWWMPMPNADGLQCVDCMRTTHQYGPFTHEDHCSLDRADAALDALEAAAAQLGFKP